MAMSRMNATKAVVLYVEVEEEEDEELKKLIDKMPKRVGQEGRQADSHGQRHVLTCCKYLFTLPHASPATETH